MLNVRRNNKNVICNLKLSRESQVENDILIIYLALKCILTNVVVEIRIWYSGLQSMKPLQVNPKYRIKLN